MQKKIPLEIVHIDVEALNPAPYNPRRWDKKAEADLTDSIKRFGLIDPILVNSATERRNIVIGGHFRLKIAKELGYKEVPVVFIKITEEERERELNLRLNRNQGAWDMELLRNFDISLLLDVGFDDSDLQHIWDDVIETEDDNFNVDEELKNITPFVQDGDLWELGSHRLICGDSTNKETLDKLLEGRKVGFVTADPPYNIGLDYNKGIGTKGKYGGTKVDDDKTDTQYEEFLENCLSNAKDHTLLDAHFFCWSDERYIGLIQRVYQKLEIGNKRVCIWLKNNQMSTPQVAFHKVFEPCIYGIRGDPFLSQYHTAFNEVMNKEVGTGNKLHGDVLDMMSVWLEKRLPSNAYEHPTAKPPTLYEKAIRRCTKPGDFILELFGGSGSTLIAAEQLKRSCFLVELDPLFCSLIIKRYEKLTGQTAKKLN
ncbi:DNA modification methylase [Candidatus Peregrinibacteria bacterium]|nr:MAG: DNA modification methylase [Candidatus Peregrinibacteria bacterium]